ncbi:unnamed protein product [Didymodactylos carnosus]|uniref:Uncharacterized protein n=1 Tax=Didymodactylos carnosus TaxID=1234261 RepID=A0A814EN06_9BILA|nr:unnamed protein product [Didymodactylos carnosus]CAF1152887.1 unnamed protein product [Didymodactylos carnosus]CAF3746439.1 unnamed protein product [Didymodactylos carnosus]CAF3961864.1 unnamed protein product [Didymodactylos carnosus]
MSTTRYPDIIHHALHDADAHRRHLMSDQNATGNGNVGYPSGQEIRRSSLSHTPTAIEQQYLNDWGF